MTDTASRRARHDEYLDEWLSSQMLGYVLPAWEMGQGRCSFKHAEILALIKLVADREYERGEKAATERAAGPHSTPEGHAAAIADTHTSHVLKGFGYLIQCEWCPETFFAPTKREAMERFRAHEQRMFDLADAIRAAGPDKGRESE